MTGKTSHLMTDWICIATEGETVDRREIPASWLTEMAETYDPSLYTAMIWPEHEKYWGNSGEVLALKAEAVDNGPMKLFARLCPTDSLIYANRRNQLLFASIEPDPDFRSSGKCYLKGLGVTSTPASVGTERMRFSAEKNNTIYGTPVPFVIDMVTERPGEKEMSDDKKPLWKSLFSVKEPEQEKPKQEENKPEFSLEALKGMAQALADLETKFNQLTTDIESCKKLAAAVEELNKNYSDIKKMFESDDAKQLFNALPDLLPKFKKLDDVFTQLPDANPGEKDKDHTAPMIV